MKTNTITGQTIQRKILQKVILGLLIISIMIPPAYAMEPWRVSMSDTDLFMKYPYYLMETSGTKDMNDAIRLLAEVVGESKGMKSAILATIVDDGKTIGLENLFSSIGFGKSHDEKLLEECTQKFLRSVSAGSDRLPVEWLNKSKKLEKSLEPIQKAIKNEKLIAGSLPKEQTISILKDILVSLGVSGADSKAAGMFDVINLKFPMSKAVKYGAEGWKGFLATVELYCYDYTLVETLMENCDKSSNLYTGLKMIKSDMQDPQKYIKSNYMRDSIIKAIGKWADKNFETILVKGLEVSKEMVSIGSLCKTMFFKVVYLGYKTDTVDKTVYFMDFSSSLIKTRNDLLFGFTGGRLTKQDIPKFKVYHNMVIAALVCGLEEMNPMLRWDDAVQNEQKSTCEYLIQTLPSQGDDYLLSVAKHAAEEAIKAGNAITVNGQTTTSTACSHTYDSSGYCSKCKQEYQISLTSMSATTYEAVKDGVPVRKRPYASDSTIKSLSKGAKVTVVASGNNSVGNLWYKLNDGTWVYSENLKKSSNGNADNISTNKPTYSDCNVRIDCVNGQTVNLYKNPGDSSRVTYFSKGQSAMSTYSAKLSDGSTWYRITANHNGTDTIFWLKYESSKMTVTSLDSISKPSYGIDMNPIMTAELVQGRYNITLKWNHIASEYEQYGEAEYYDVQLGRSGTEFFDRSSYYERIPASQHVNGVLTYTFEDVDYKDGTYSATIFAYGNGGKIGINYASSNKIEVKTTHVHSLGYDSGKAASCVGIGRIANYHCIVCGAYFTDENATNEITYQSTQLEPLGHNYVSGICSRCEAPDPDYTVSESTHPDSVGAVEVNFSRNNTYYQGQFSDVPRNQWFTDSVAEAYELGLMKGDGDYFNPYGDVTLAETITMAVRIHSIYTHGKENFDQGIGDAWYQTYLDYAYENGIISGGFFHTDVTRKATRAQFAEIFANSLPVSALATISNVAENAIPDVSMSDSYASYVYRLYRAGILTGGDERGSFSPQTHITRAESAAIVSRMAGSSNRVQFTLR